MNLLRKILKIALVFIVLLVAGLWLFSTTLQPTYKGELSLKNLSNPVAVNFDAIGVPHIKAQNQQDAYRALGYVHAQDRLWQMELIRRIAAGRLSEVFGSDLLATDVFFSGLGIEAASEKTIQQLDKNSKAYQYTLAYLDGINQFIENGPTPLEFYLVGLEKEKYSIKDVYNVFGYMAFSFAAAQKTDPLLTEIKEKLGNAYWRELQLGDVKNTTLIHNQKNSVIQGEWASAMNKIYKKLPVSSFIGSNSWVLGPEKTKRGKVIFANDPHISFSQPSVWYESYIKTPNYEIYGFNLALTPFPLLGHNHQYAYGLTMFENDDIDFYAEENNPANPLEYKTANGFKKYTQVEKRIKIKGAKDTVYTVLVSQHGPIMNGLLKNITTKKPMAMQWIYTRLQNQLLEVGYELSHATSLATFKAGASKLHAPGLNIMYGDADNNIAWFAAAKLYTHRDSLNTKLVLDGASGKDEIMDYLDFSENPQAVNPSWHYVYSANNQPDSIRGGFYPGYYLPQDRAKRITELLAAKNDFTKEDVAAMQTDVTSAMTTTIIKDLDLAIAKENLSASQRKALQILKSWKGYYGKESIAPTIYNRFVYEFLVGTYKDELGASFNQFINTPLQKKVMEEQVKKDKSIWWDNINTKNVQETKQQIVTEAFRKAIAFLQDQLGENIDDWHWNRVISVEYNHAMGKVALLRKFFNVGPFKTLGGNEVINNQIFNLDSTGVYKINAGPSTRRIVDFSDVESSWAILPTGQSGNVFSKHYKDQAEKYLEGKYETMMINQKEISELKKVLIFKPK